MVRRSRYTDVDHDELRSAAYVALVEAAQTFDAANNVNFATFARHRIRGALIDCRRWWLKMSRSAIRVDSPRFRRLSERDEREGKILAVEDSSELGYSLEEVEEVERHLRRLTKAQASACRLIYLDGKSQDETAALLGYSKAYLSRLHRDALESLGRECALDPDFREKTRGHSWN